jgi:hypothetical protein
MTYFSDSYPNCINYQVYTKECMHTQILVSITIIILVFFLLYATYNYFETKPSRDLIK